MLNEVHSGHTTEMSVVSVPSSNEMVPTNMTRDLIFPFYLFKQNHTAKQNILLQANRSQRIT